MDNYNIRLNNSDIDGLANKTDSELKILFIVYKIKNRDFIRKMYSIIENLEKNFFNVDIIILIQNEFYLGERNNAKYIYVNDNDLWRNILFSTDNITLDKKYDIMISYSNIIATEFMLRTKSDSIKTIFIDKDVNLDKDIYTSSYLSDLFDKLDKVIYEN